MTLKEIWDKNYDLLGRYYKNYCNTNVAHGYMMDGKDLGAWVHYQRTAYKKGLLEDYKIVRLNKLNMDFNISDTRFLNKPITNMELYKSVLIKRANLVLRDLTFEDKNLIGSYIRQKELEKVMIKRIWG